MCTDWFAWIIVAALAIGFAYTYYTDKKYIHELEEARNMLAVKLQDLQR